MNYMGPLIHKLDEQVKSTRKSQTDLNNKIEEMSNYLKEITNSIEAPFDMESHVRKLEDSRSRILHAQTVLANIQERVGNLQKGIQRETFHLKQENGLTPEL
uniref:Biogenesis of lysosome-related organelles complex 1 subunit 7 n=1 Tax=Rhabditophanes sp. KR3021 TaxID=114890 RepID=A0AC35UG51_9BILA